MEKMVKLNNANDDVDDDNNNNDDGFDNEDGTTRAPNSRSSLTHSRTTAVDGITVANMVELTFYTQKSRIILKCRKSYNSESKGKKIEKESVRSLVNKDRVDESNRSAHCVFVCMMCVV